MDAKLRRRRFLQSASALGLGASLGSASALRAITPAGAAEMAVGPEAVRLRPEIEPVVRWIEETPRERILDVAVEQLRGGLSYRELLAGLFLAGIRNVQPRPVGFKFHTVLVINSAHLLGQTAEVQDRLLPLFWALDNFKNAQAQDVKEGDWTLAPVDESHVPGPGKAKAAFVRAMDDWDADGADVAVAGLCRTSGAAETMEPFWRYGLRDHRNIGHKAIFAAQSWRTLQAIGWQHAEPVLRSLAYGLLDMERDQKPGAVGPYDVNIENAGQIRDDWQAGKPDPGATVELLAAIRQSGAEEASVVVVRLLNRGVAPNSLWDAVILAAGELMIRSPGLIPIHAVTSANALHYIYEASGDDTNRRLALLQAAGWIPLFRDRTKPPASPSIDSLEPLTPDGSGDDAIGDIFATINQSRGEAARKAIGYLDSGGSPDLIFAAARRMIFRKGKDSHDYKFAAAAWEEFRLAADPKWHAPLAAAALCNFPGSKTADSPLMRRAQAALAQVADGRG